MQKRCIGDITVSRIGLGTAKFGRNQAVKYPRPFDLPSDQIIKNLLALAHELGINLLDTAPAYGTSEERLGFLLKDSRHEWVICTKAGEEFIDGVSHFDFSKAAINKSVERSLRRLHTDYVDFLLIHSNGDDLKIIEQDQVFETLRELQQAGKIRSCGMSCKTVAGGFQTIDNSDVAMVTYNPAYTDEKSVIKYAQTKNKGVFIKKAFNSGYLEPEKALRFIFAEPGITSVILGTINSEHLVQNVKQLVSI